MGRCVGDTWISRSDPPVVKLWKKLTNGAQPPAGVRNHLMPCRESTPDASRPCEAKRHVERFEQLADAGRDVGWGWGDALSSAAKAVADCGGADG